MSKGSRRQGVGPPARRFSRSRSKSRSRSFDADIQRMTVDAEERADKAAVAQKKEAEKRAIQQKMEERKPDPKKETPKKKKPKDKSRETAVEGEV